MAVTIKDVAREANVSPSTVSKVMNHSPSIPDITVKHVEEVMKRLHYYPNASARNFVRKKTMNIVFLTKLEPHIAFTNPHMFDIMCGVQEILSQKNYNLSIKGIHSAEESEQIADEIIAEKSADGIVVHGAATTKNLANLLVKSKFPHIIIGKPDFESQACWIDNNNFLSGQIAAEHLVECGYKKISFIGGAESDTIFMQRLGGFLSAMNEHKINVPEEYVKYGVKSKKNGFAQALELIALKKRPDAIICEDNTAAYNALDAIKKSKLKIPEDIAFICFDNYPFTEIMEPLPTVVDINVHDMGMQAAVLLLRKIKHPELQVQSYTTLPILKSRNSTCSCLKDDIKPEENI